MDRGGGPSRRGLVSIGAIVYFLIGLAILLGPSGQKILKKHGFVPAADLAKENQP